MNPDPSTSGPAEPSSDFEKDRVAWNLPGPKTSAPASARGRDDLPLEPSDRSDGEREASEAA